ncbi:glycerophosphodiester phosphodiesterase family protein [Edaphobacter sp. HDX4]|uniref:glycerophosphodiester phosphodiesterase family protein n=1 Tax=Edaphobacter sp. HDX4 TaxID=2794064 RepID=UPI002FE5AC2B
MTRQFLGGVILCVSSVAAMEAQGPVANPYMQLMDKAWAHAKAHGAGKPVLSPVDATVLSGEVPLKELQAQGFKVVPWTTNDPEKMRTEIRMGVDGLITDGRICCSRCWVKSARRRSRTRTASGWRSSM